MTAHDLWTENQVLREKLLELQQRYEQERTLRIDLQAENVWIRRMLRDHLGLVPLPAQSVARKPTSEQPLPSGGGS